MGPGGAPSPAERPLITMMLHHRTDLGLSDEQVRRLEQLRGDFTRETIRREADLRIAEMDLAQLLAREPLDLPQAEAKIRETAQLRTDLRIARLKTIEQGKAVLTAEQRGKLASLLDGMASHHPGAGSPPERGGTRL
jgi:Spy/CpxP family protein refolding chaperone